MYTPASFEQIYRQNYRPLFRLAYALLQDEDDCKDVIHETMANLWEKQPDVEPEKIGGYLKQAVYHACLNQLAYRERTQKLKQMYPEILQFRGSAQTNQELWEKIQMFIQERMPEKTREVIRLCFMEKMTYKEVAELLQTSIASVNKHVVTGLRMLRDEFNPTE